ncbi:MAG: PA0069 family radical SAM protein [Burkholderiales bacterium]
MLEIPIPLLAIKGRGAATRLAHRFERSTREALDDGWNSLQDLQHSAAPPATQVIWEDVKSVITKNASPDISFDYSINPYRGCEHGCSYCFARPTHSYLGLSPGLDFETQIIAKRNIAKVLRAELASPRFVPRLLSIGNVTDCYQPLERELLLTRQVIELLCEAQHPFGLVTKSSGVERDMDLIAPAAHHKRAVVYITITTLDSALSRKLEPRAASPQRRLRTIKTLADAGIAVGVSVAPQIPFLNTDMEQVLAAAHAAGARTAFYTVIRLPWEVAPLFKQWLELHAPERAARIMARIHDMRGGKDYDSAFATRMKGSGLWAELLRQRFEKTCARLGLNRERTALDLSQFKRPGSTGQASLF